MKKLLMFLFAAFLMTGIAACNGEETTVERTYAADGEYTAFLINTHYNGTPMMTSVTVTIENDEITEFDIDALQANSAFEWNAETKKELGYAYRMHGQRELSEADYITWLADNDKLEWFEQAEILEAEWVENGIDSVTVTDGEFESLADVTISDGHYTELAEEAVQNAIDGKVIAFEATMSHGKPQVTWVEIQLDENGDMEDITIDVLQSSITQTAGADTPEDDTDDTFEFAWNEETKQELGYAYRMHGQRELSEADYITWLADNDKLEWFEQAEIIQNEWLENGVDSITTVEGEFESLADVSISDGGYVALAQEAFNKIG